MPANNDKFNALLEAVDGREPEQAEQGSDGISEGYPGGIDPATYKKAESVANDVLQIKQMMKGLAAAGKQSSALAKQLEELDWYYQQYTPKLESVADRAYKSIRPAVMEAISEVKKSNDMVAKFVRDFLAARGRA